MGVNEDFVYRTESTRLGPGDGVFLFTDGVTEAIDTSNELFSEARLEAYLETTKGWSPVEIVAGALRAVDDFVGAAPQFDDITALSVRYRLD
jgi:sigma-B regulation protein RsbU (phosphoserine phosphatase)